MFQFICCGIHLCYHNSIAVLVLLSQLWTTTISFIRQFSSKLQFFSLPLLYYLFNDHVYNSNCTLSNNLASTTKYHFKKHQNNEISVKIFFWAPPILNTFYVKISHSKEPPSKKIINLIKYISILLHKIQNKITVQNGAHCFTCQTRDWQKRKELQNSTKASTIWRITRMYTTVTAVVFSGSNPMNKTLWHKSSRPKSNPTLPAKWCVLTCYHGRASLSSDVRTMA